jgi:FecR protein
MNMERRCILLVAPLAFALANWLPNELLAADLEDAQVTQVVQDVKVLPSGASARPAAVNETVRRGSAVQTGTQSRSELTFKDQTITRLGEKTIFNVGGEGRTIELGSGQFLLYVPKKSGGAKIKMGAVTAAITGTTVSGNVSPSGVIEFTVLEGTACIHLDRVGQSLMVTAGQKVVYDPIAMSLENPVDVDLQQQLTSPLIAGFRRLPSAPLIDEAIQNQHRTGAANGELARAVAAAGAGSIDTASPGQFLSAFSSLLVRSNPGAVCTLVGAAVRARPDLADRIVVAAVTGMRPVRGYSKEAKDFKGKQVSCDWVQCIIQSAIAANPAAADEITSAVLQAAPMLRDCIPEPCPPANAFVPPYIISPLTPQVLPVISPEQPPTNNGG